MKSKIYKLLIASLLIGGIFLLSGCIGGKTQTIEVKTLKNGSTIYHMNKANLNVKTKKYRGYNIDDYNIELSSNVDTITLTLNHELSFTQGTGTPILYHPYNPPGDPNDPKNFSNKRWQYERFWKGLKKVDIEGLDAINHSKVAYTKSAIFDSFTESISTTYNKQAFINYVKSHPNLHLTITSHKPTITSNILEIEKVKKFVGCLENRDMCVDKNSNK